MAKSVRTVRTYTDEEKQNAVAVANAKGLARACEELKIPKSSIKTWAKALNIDVASQEATAAVERATTVSVANRAQRIAEAKERMVDSMIRVAEKAAEVEMKMLTNGENRLDHVVGSRTRAIHDLQLLEGKPTDIVEEIDVAELIRLRDETK